MSLETRLARCIAYRNKAMELPIENALYIEDLNLSIEMFSKSIASTPLLADGKPIINKGWEDEET